MNVKCLMEFDEFNIYEEHKIDKKELIDHIIKKINNGISEEEITKTIISDYNISISEIEKILK